MKRSRSHKPVREIGITNRSVSGIVPEIGQYESSLERDFMEICRFDDTITEVIPQPTTIPYETITGALSSYTPDGLIHFDPNLSLNSILFEIKHVADFKKDWRVFMSKFRIGKLYAEENGWEFRVFTERYIRTVYLDNIKFLWSFKNRRPPESFIQRVQEVMFDLQECDPEMLLHILCKTPINRARMIPVVWYMVGNKLIGCDLEKPLNMHSKIWFRGEYEND